jgi:hypothetical protein
MRLAPLSPALLLVVLGFVVGICIAHYSAATLLSYDPGWEPPTLHSSVELAGTIRSLDASRSSFELELASPYSEALPLRVKYDTNTAFKMNTVESQRAMRPEDLTQGMSVLVSVPREAGAFHAEYVIAVTYL